MADGSFRSTWGLFGILLLSAIIVFALFFYSANWMLQVRMTVFSSVLLIVFILLYRVRLC